DIFAAGMLLYELCTLEHPFKRPGYTATSRAILRGLYLPPDVLRPDCPPAVMAVVARALRRNPADRFASAGEMARALASSGNTDLEVVQALGGLVREVTRQRPG